MSARRHPCFDTWLSAPGSGACSWTIDNQRRPRARGGCHRGRRGKLTRLEPNRDVAKRSTGTRATAPDP